MFEENQSNFNQDYQYSNNDYHYVDVGPQMAEDGILVDEQGYEDIGFSIVAFILGGLGLYFGQSFFAILIQSVVGMIIRKTGKAPHAENLSNFSALVGTIICLVIFFIIIHKKLKPLLKEFANGKTWAKALAYVGIMYGAIFLYSWIITVLGANQATSANQDSINLMMEFTPILAGIYVCIVAPIFEEITFRLCIFRGIAKKNKIAALIVVASIFGLIHMLASLTTGTFKTDLITLPIYLIGGFGLTTAYFREKRIGVSICAHFIYNTISFIMNLIAAMIIF